MTPQQFVGLGVRLFAIWLVLQGIGIAVSTMEVLVVQSNNKLPMTVSPWMFTTSFVLLLAATALWIFPMAVAHRVIPRTSFTNRLDASAVDVARVAFAVLGLWILVEHLPSLIGFLIRGLFVTSDESVLSSLSAKDKIYLATTCFQVAMGVLLFAKATKIASIVIVQRVETGSDRPSSAEENHDRSSA